MPNMLATQPPPRQTASVPSGAFRAFSSGQARRGRLYARLSITLPSKWLGQGQPAVQRDGQVGRGRVGKSGDFATRSRRGGCRGRCPSRSVWGALVTIGFFFSNWTATADNTEASDFI